MLSLHKIIKSVRTLESGFYRVPLQPLVLVTEDETQKDDEGYGSEPEQETLIVDGEAERIVQVAREEAQKILNQAYLEAEAAKEDAFRRGVEEGASESGKLLDEARELMACVSAIREEIIKSSEPQVIELSLQIAKQLIKTSVLIEPELIKEIVADAVSLLAGDESIMVKVNPDDLSICRLHKDFFRELLTDGASIKFLPSDETEKGSCTVQGQFTLVESFLQERFKILSNALLKEASHATRQAD